MTHRIEPSPTPVVAETLAEIRASMTDSRNSGKTVGFVPTMGALHAGHVSLIERARSECDTVVVSIFVNPTQFGPNEDFRRYPRPRDLDLKICGDAGADIVFYPSVEVMYPVGYRTFVEVQGLSDILEGAIRPGHFRGVATVVTKLFMIVLADRAYFGQKDYQQQLLIRTMSDELNIPTRIVTCPTLRDPDGMAMSSRNAYLSADERQRGLCLSQALNDVAHLVEAGERDIRRLQRHLCERMSATPGVIVDYGVIVDAGTLSDITEAVPEMVALVAARVGSTRLIDNRVLRLA
jgi:pantoate--beta-alanine ligase